MRPGQAVMSGRTQRPEESQSPDEAYGNPVHLLRHPHGKRGAAGGLLKRRNAHGKELSKGNYTSVIENGQHIRLGRRKEK